MFILCLFRHFFRYVGCKFSSHLSWKEPVLDFFPLHYTTKASPGDQTHATEVAGLEVIYTKTLDRMNCQ